MDKPKLLIADDDKSVQLAMKRAFAQKFEISFACNRQEAIEIFRREKPQLVTLGLGLPPLATGIEEGFLTLTSLLQKDDPLATVIIISGHDEKENAIAAIKQGAFDFFCKPVEVEEANLILLRALRVHQLESEHRKLQARDSFEKLLGTSSQMQEVFSTIERVAATEVPILILGENGTGKKLIARTVHEKSQRKAGPFVAINCAASSETILESELFGHEEGAYTGAHGRRKGGIELADGGTLVLDEVGDLPASLQVKLLRFLQENKIERIEGRKKIALNTRVIAVTNRDINQATRGGTFRKDLYSRLGVVQIQVPPLRDREGDIALLAMSFVRKYTKEKKKILGFTNKALAALVNHKFPGNVRELENRIMQAVITARSSNITNQDLDLPELKRPTLRDARDKVDRELIPLVLTDNNFNIAQSAVDLGISRPALYDLIEKLGIALPKAAKPQ